MSNRKREKREGDVDGSGKDDDVKAMLWGK
jgi:hypothetical protein